MSSPVPDTDRLLHRFASGLAGGVVLLIAAGALVKSKEAGLAVPDWPLSYGLLNPPRWWEIDNVRAEHGHRLIAGTVAMLTVLLALLVARREPRRWVRRIAWLAVVAVFAQALLGGITVLFFLPPAVSTSHAALAEIFLCLVVTLAVVTSSGWHRGPQNIGSPGSLTRLATVTTSVLFGQIFVGAVMRHSGAGLAIPDFPLVFGGLIPPRFDFAISIHYAHRLGALLVLALVAGVCTIVFRRHAGEQRLRRAAAAMAALVVVQIALGGAVVLTGKAVLPNTVHVATGASLLAVSLVLTLFAFRLRGEAPSRSTAKVAAGRALGETG